MLHRPSNLFDDDRARIGAVAQAAGNVGRVHAYLQNKPVLQIPAASRDPGISQPTVTSTLSKLEESGMVREITGKSRNRIYVYSVYLEILNEDAQPL